MMIINTKNRHTFLLPVFVLLLLINNSCEMTPPAPSNESSHIGEWYAVYVDETDANSQQQIKTKLDSDQNLLISVLHDGSYHELTKGVYETSPDIDQMTFRITHLQVKNGFALSGITLPPTVSPLLGDNGWMTENDISTLLNNPLLPLLLPGLNLDMNDISPIFESLVMSYELDGSMMKLNQDEYYRSEEKAQTNSNTGMIILNPF